MCKYIINYFLSSSTLLLLLLLTNFYSANCNAQRYRSMVLQIHAAEGQVGVGKQQCRLEKEEKQKIANCQLLILNMEGSLVCLMSVAYL